jgi:transposase
MEYGAIDLHKRSSHIRVVRADGSVVLERKIVTTREEFARVFAERQPLRILVESGTESEWVAQHLETLGHEVVVADPNFLPMYGSRSRRVKTDRRDVAALGEACRTGMFRRAYRAGAATRALRRTLRVRTHLVRARTNAISVLRSLLRQEGIRVGTGAAEQIVAHLDRVALSPVLAAAVTPLRALLSELNRLLVDANATVDAQATTDPITRRLMTVPGVGPVVAVTFRAVLDDPARFGGDARRASAFVGVVPSEDSSAERRHKGHITKTGPRDLRALLVQASWVIWRSRRPAAQALRAWAHALAARRGRRIAMVAVARRLTRILFALWRDATTFGAPRPRLAAAAG